MNTLGMDEYAEIFNSAKFSMKTLFPNGEMPTDPVSRLAAISILREKRALLEKISQVKRIESIALQSLEAEILSDANEEVKKEIRRKDKANDHHKPEVNRSNRDKAMAGLIAAGFPPEQASLMVKNMQAGAIRVPGVVEKKEIPTPTVSEVQDISNEDLLTLFGEK